MAGRARHSIFALYLASAVFVTVQQGVVGRSNNFKVFRAAAVNLLAHRDLYAAHPDQHFDFYKYSPTFTLLSAPFAGAAIRAGAPDLESPQLAAAVVRRAALAPRPPGDTGPGARLSGSAVRDAVHPEQRARDGAHPARLPGARAGTSAAGGAADRPRCIHQDLPARRRRAGAVSSPPLALHAALRRRERGPRAAAAGRDSAARAGRPIPLVVGHRSVRRQSREPRRLGDAIPPPVARNELAQLAAAARGHPGVAGSDRRQP